MTDYRKLMDKRYLGSWDIPESGSIVDTITNVRQEAVIGQNGKRQDCIVAILQTHKPMILNATNCGALSRLFGSTYIEQWRGPIEIRAQATRFGGQACTGLRIRDVAPGARRETETLTAVLTDPAEFK